MSEDGFVVFGVSFSAWIFSHRYRTKESQFIRLEDWGVLVVGGGVVHQRGLQFEDLDCNVLSQTRVSFFFSPLVSIAFVSCIVIWDDVHNHLILDSDVFSSKLVVCPWILRMFKSSCWWEVMEVLHEGLQRWSLAERKQRKWNIDWVFACIFTKREK